MFIIGGQNMVYNKNNSNIISNEWNLNQRWLFLMTDLMATFIESDFNHDFEGMYTSLLHLETLISPSIDDNKIEKNLIIIRDKMDMMERKDEEGNIICLYPLAQREVQKLLHKTHGLILQMLDEKGILKKIQQDPRTVMGNFGGS